MLRQFLGLVSHGSNLKLVEISPTGRHPVVFNLEDAEVVE